MDLDALQVSIIGLAMFLIGILVGIAIEGEAIRNDVGYYECIIELPRYRDCKLIAVPDNQE